MNIQDLLHFSFQSFKNRKSRVIFTVAGVAVGISVIIFLISLGYGLQNTILDRITTEEALLSLDVFSPDGETLPLTLDSVQRIGRIEGIESINPKAVIPAQISHGSLTSEASINLVNQEYFKFAGLRIEQGTLFNKGGNEILITQTVAELLNFDKEDLLGKEIGIKMSFEGEQPTTTSTTSLDEEVIPEAVIFEDQFKIVGILEDSETLNDIYVHIEDIDARYIKNFESIKVKVESPDDIEPVRQHLADQGFLVSALSDLAEQANKVFGIIQIILAIFGVFSLLVAAIGLVNTMTISLLERTNEIGIMRAIGASKSDIKKLFLLESSMIGLMGGITGIVLGMASAEIMNIILNIFTRAFGQSSLDVFFTPLWFILFIIVSSALVGFISGVFPAQKASRLNTLEALRYK